MSYILVLKALQNKFLFLFLIFLFTSIDGSAQDPMFSQFMFRQLYHNPAYAGTSSNPRLMGGYRNQWPGMNNAFSTYYMTYDQQISAIKSGIGVSILKDVMGNSTFGVTGFDLNYNYQTIASRSINISLGLSSGFYQKSLNGTNVVLPDQSPFGNSFSQENITNESIWYPDFGFGAYMLINKRHSISAALHHLNRPDISLTNSGVRLPIRFGVQYSTEFHSYVGKFNEKTMIIIPGIIYQQQDRYNYMSAGANIDYQPFICGLWLRSDNKFSVESFTILLGYYLSNFKFVYSFDARLINFSKNVINNGAHEVTCQIYFKYKKKKKMKQVKCPKF